MHRNYFIYVHEKDCYDLYLFSEMVQTISHHFVIAFEDPVDVLPFLSSIQDNSYPVFIIVDWHDHAQVQTFFNELQQVTAVSALPVLVLWEIEKPALHNHIRLYERPQNREGWEHLANYIMQYCQVPSR